MKLDELSPCNCWGIFGSIAYAQERRSAKQRCAVGKWCLLGTFKVLKKHCAEEAF